MTLASTSNDSCPVFPKEKRKKYRTLCDAAADDDDDDDDDHGGPPVAGMRLGGQLRPPGLISEAFLRSSNDEEYTCTCLLLRRGLVTPESTAHLLFNAPGPKMRQKSGQPTNCSDLDGPPVRKACQQLLHL